MSFVAHAVVFAVALLWATAMAQNTTCSSSLHMIVSRGSGEAPGPGRISAFVDGILAGVNGSTNSSIAYVATIANYEGSVLTGVNALKLAVSEYATACPKTKIALLGYSQVSTSIVSSALFGWG
jgi:acetylxylan esterase